MSINNFLSSFEMLCDPNSGQERSNLFFQYLVIKSSDATASNHPQFIAFRVALHVEGKLQKLQNEGAYKKPVGWLFRKHHFSASI